MGHVVIKIEARLVWKVMFVQKNFPRIKVKVPIMEQICRKIFCASDSERIKAKGKI